MMMMQAARRMFGLIGTLFGLMGENARDRRVRQRRERDTFRAFTNQICSKPRRKRSNPYAG